MKKEEEGKERRANFFFHIWQKRDLLLLLSYETWRVVGGGNRNSSKSVTRHICFKISSFALI